MKIFTVDFTPMWPVPAGLIIAAKTRKTALRIAQETIKHTQVTMKDVTEISIEKPCVVFYESGNY